MVKKLLVSVSVSTACTLIFCIIFGNNVLVTNVRDFYIPFLSLASNISKEFKSYFTDIEYYKNTNVRLEREILEMKKSQSTVSEYKLENDRLKKLLDLENEMNSYYETVAAMVVSYEPNNWYDTIVINKGELSGISVGNAVVSVQGLVGKVVETGKGYSIISTVLNPDLSFAARISQSGELGLLEGDAGLSKDKLCRMSYIEKPNNINRGDLVETTGSGGIFPSGLIVGTIKEIQSNNTVPYAVVEPSVDIRNLYEVLVIRPMQ